MFDIPADMLSNEIRKMMDLEDNVTRRDALYGVLLLIERLQLQLINEFEKQNAEAIAKAEEEENEKNKQYSTKKWGISDE